MDVPPEYSFVFIIKDSRTVGKGRAGWGSVEIHPVTPSRARRRVGEGVKNRS